MAGETDPRSPVTPSPKTEFATLSPRKVALVRVVVGVPMLAVALFGLVIAYRLSGRPLGDSVFWLAILAVFIGFAVYFARPLVVLFRRS